MSSLSPYAVGLTLGALLPAATSRWVALYTTLPGADGTGGVEVGAAYARAENAAWVDEAPPVGLVGARGNTVDVYFNAFTADVPGVVGFGFFDALVAGNLLAWGPLRNPVTQAVITRDFVAGDIAHFAAGELEIGIAAMAD